MTDTNVDYSDFRILRQALEDHGWIIYPKGEIHIAKKYFDRDHSYLIGIKKGGNGIEISKLTQSMPQNWFGKEVELIKARYKEIEGLRNK
jgi:hypothetical protein